MSDVTGDLFTWTPPPAMPSAEAARAARDAAIASVESHTAGDWATLADVAVADLARANLDFTADDFWQLAYDRGFARRVHDPRAFGAVMLRAAKRGIVRNSGRMRPSRRRHMTPITVWESLIVQPLVRHGQR